MHATAKLQRFIDDELTRATAMADKTVELVLPLLQQRDTARTPAEREHCQTLAQILPKQRPAFVHAFGDGLRNAVTADMQGSSTSGAKKRGLELMDEARIEVDIEISGAAQLMIAAAEWELRELQTFTSTLAGYEHVVAETNPLQPTAYARALWDAVCVVTPAMQQRAMLMRTAAGVMSHQLKMAWAAASSRLEEQGVEPGMYRTVVLAPGPPASRDFPGEDARSDALHRLLSGAQAVETPAEHAATNQATANPAEGAAAFESVLNRLDVMLQRAGKAAEEAPAIPHNRGAAPALPSKSVDRHAMEVLPRLFESVLADGRLPPAFHSVIARLQVSALRVALLDPGMLSEHEHPVWRLMNRIGGAAECFSQPTDPRSVALLQFCVALVDDIASAATPEGALYNQALERLEAFLAAQLREQQAQSQSTSQALERLEQYEALERQVMLSLREQMASIRTSAAACRFIQGDWAKVLAHAMQDHGEKSEPTLTYLKATEDLLWSLRLPDHPQSRKRLLQLLPGLLKTLAQGMTTIGTAQAQQKVVFDELMALHTEALRAGKDAPSDADLSSQQIVQQMQDETSWDVPGPAPFSDSLIDVHSMDTVPADLLPSAMGSNAEAAEGLQALRVGDRLHLFIHGRWTRVQLLWRSPAGGYLLFAGADPQRPHSVTRHALERLSKEGLMKPIDDVSLVQRAVDRLTRKLALPA